MIQKTNSHLNFSVNKYYYWSVNIFYLELKYIVQWKYFVCVFGGILNYLTELSNEIKITYL